MCASIAEGSSIKDSHRMLEDLFFTDGTLNRALPCRIMQRADVRPLSKEGMPKPDYGLGYQVILS